MTLNSNGINREPIKCNAWQSFEEASAALDALRTELDQALEERQLDRVADLLDKMKSLAATLDELANKLED